MIIPLRTSRPPRRRPLVTEALILVNMLVYLAGLLAEFGGLFDRAALLELGHLGRERFHVGQLITYQFLHDPRSIWHLAFNMLFLWVFGSAVEDRLGRASYAGFYLLGGAVAGLAHLMISPNPVIGASGSVAAVTGAFLALFPRSRIQVLIFFFIIGVYSIPSLWFIGFYFVIDVLRQTGALLGAGGGARVAYAAHIAGYLYGFGLAFVLLALGIVKRGEFDIFSLFRQSRRRAAFRAASGGRPGGLWDSASADTGRRAQRLAERSDGLTDDEARYATERSEISRLIDGHDLATAAAKYAQLLDRDPPPVFPERQQLDLANQLQTEQRFEAAAKAYEILLRAYPACPSGPEVRLMLAVIYGRRLDQPQRARQHIEAARAALTDPAQRALAEQLLAEVGA